MLLRPEQEDIPHEASHFTTLEEVLRDTIRIETFQVLLDLIHLPLLLPIDDSSFQEDLVGLPLDQEVTAPLKQGTLEGDHTKHQLPCHGSTHHE